MAFVEEAQFDRAEPMPAQTATWTCSACSLAWLNRAMGIDRGTDEWSAVELIGKPENINASYGLMDGSGGRLAQLLREDRGAAWTAWVGWSDICGLVVDHAVLLGGASWYHWIGVRDFASEGLSIANSAPGWKGIYQTLNEQQFLALGPFASVVVPVHWEFPPSDGA